MNFGTGKSSRDGAPRLAGISHSRAIKVRAGTAVALWVAAAVTLVGAETYTATVPLGTGPLTFTNCIAVMKNHEPGCTLIRYVEKGPGDRTSTNEFHAWLVPVTVKTNRP